MENHWGCYRGFMTSIQVARESQKPSVGLPVLGNLCCIFILVVLNVTLFPQDCHVGLLLCSVILWLLFENLLPLLA